MAEGPDCAARFADAFVDELGKWAARLLIAAVVAILSGYVRLPI